MDGTFTIPEASAKLGVSIGTFRKLLYGGDMPYIRVSPRRIVIPVSAFEEWMREKTQEAHRDA